ncbi:unnamed protein product [Clonostachys chloroleuca]|uniref:Xylanolytic transcriptional activator regulatory domain-containing protein n=1 Tax=Clonostachys chloroleuca TaxID=1926264 RepID=A0AA35MDU7_9HYPO|nr:unnamed protein product [Clonostachys chloroleuca]
MATPSLWFQVGVGDDGTIIYNGPTSRFHAGSLDEGPEILHGGETSPQVNALMSQYTLMDSVWMPLISTKQYLGGTSVPTETGLALLDIYWTWLHPLHNCVYRPALIMDLALGGPNCSKFLLMCIFGLVARHLPEEHPGFSGVGKGEIYISEAKQLLLEEMAAAKPSIPTIQGLLILGGRQCAMGKSSEGWLYTGMALRMMTDIGLHLDTTKLAHLERWTPSETEMRKRLYNSAYIWDKTLSLALGRPPSLIRRPYEAHEILDKFDDDRPWAPILTFQIPEVYSPCPSMNTSTFCAFCRIHEITADMMLLFSNIPILERFSTQINDLDKRLQSWYNDLPQILKITEPENLNQSPPPHIVSINLLYHALRILLRRPYLSSSDSQQRDQHMNDCITYSVQINAIHGLYARTFPDRLMTYQVSYCIFIAASIEVQELQTAPTSERRDAAAKRLTAAVKVLQDEAAHTPGVGRSLDTIRRLLRADQHKNLKKGISNEHSISSTPTRRTQAARMLINAGNVPPVSPRPPDLTSVHEVADPYPIFASTNLFGDFDDVGSAWTDTGAGFHPEVISWSGTDNLQRPSNMPTFGDQAWGSF